MQKMSCSDAQQMAQLKYWYMNSISVSVLHIFSAQENEVGTRQHQKNLMQLNGVHARCMQRGHLVAMRRLKAWLPEATQWIWKKPELSGYLSVWLLPPRLEIQGCSAGQIAVTSERLCPLLNSCEQIKASKVSIVCITDFSFLFILSREKKRRGRGSF